jgi:hypothetical protein
MDDACISELAHSVLNRTSMFTVHGRHGVVTCRLRALMEYLVAGSGHTESKSPLKEVHDCVIFECPDILNYDPCTIKNYLKIQTGNFFSISHEIVGTMEIGASFQRKPLKEKIT